MIIDATCDAALLWLSDACAEAEIDIPKGGTPACVIAQCRLDWRNIHRTCELEHNTIADEWVQIVGSPLINTLQLSHVDEYELKQGPWLKMKFIDTFFAIVTTLLTVQAVALPSRSHGKPEKPAYFVLAGDSTTAGSSANGGGWGDGFLNTTLRKPASGKNFGHNGATTVSFRAGGDWAAVLEDVKSHTQSNKVFVTIQVSTPI